MMCISQIMMLYTLKGAVRELYFNKTRRKNTQEKKILKIEWAFWLYWEGP